MQKFIEFVTAICEGSEDAGAFEADAFSSGSEAGMSSKVTPVLVAHNGQAFDCRQVHPQTRALDVQIQIVS